VTEPVVEALIVDLLQWLANGDRTYEQVMDGWRTSCPRLTVWEDANDRGFVRSERVDGQTIIKVSSLGLAFLRKARPAASLPTVRSNRS
jgi:hypothetical protein